MAARRFFSLAVCGTDKFLDMPPTSQNLYYTLGLHADDDGFVSSPRGIARSVRAGDDDLRLLMTKEYVIPFDSGVCVITHWPSMNHVQPSKKTKTIYQDELSSLTISSVGSYVQCRTLSDESPAQVRLGKYSNKSVEFALDDASPSESALSIVKPVVKKKTGRTPGRTPGWPTTQEQNEIADLAVDYMNDKYGRRFQKLETWRQMVRRTFNKKKSAHENAPTLDNYKAIIDVKVQEWTGTDSQKYIRPATLFATDHYDTYLTESQTSSLFMGEPICQLCESSFENGICIGCGATQGDLNYG